MRKAAMRVCSEHTPSESGILDFETAMDAEPDGTFAIRVYALGQKIEVCRSPYPKEALRRWHNTVSDLTDLQRIGEQKMAQGVSSDVVIRAFLRLRESHGIPNLNFID